VCALGHREIAVTGGADLDDRRNRQRRATVSGHRLILAEVLDMMTEPDDRRPAVQDELVRPRPLPGTQRTHVRSSSAVVIGHESERLSIGHGHRRQPAYVVKGTAGRSGRKDNAQGVTMPAASADREQRGRRAFQFLASHEQRTAARSVSSRRWRFRSVFSKPEQLNGCAGVHWTGVQRV